MKIYIQWALSNPQDWVLLDAKLARDIRNLPKKPVPTGSSTLDNNPGWINAINCQGIEFSGYDHIGVEIVGGSLRITGWQDDTEDFGDTRWATAWTLSNPAPDPKLGGVINTVQSRQIYATPDAAAWFPGVAVLPWSTFVPPPSNQTIHGIWLPDNLYMDHRQRASEHSWREWIA